LWVHLFEPHAPYGDPRSGRSTLDRYDDEIATADREVGRLLGALGDAARDTAVIVAADHGEAFGEHGEYAHSIFVYDTTLRVPLVMRGPGILANAARRTVHDEPRPTSLERRTSKVVIPDPVTLADVGTSAMRWL